MFLLRLLADILQSTPFSSKQTLTNVVSSNAMHISVSHPYSENNGISDETGIPLLVGKTGCGQGDGTNIECGP